MEAQSTTEHSRGNENHWIFVFKHHKEQQTALGSTNFVFMK